MFRRVLAAAVTVIAAGFLLACAWPQLFGLEKAQVFFLELRRLGTGAEARWVVDNWVPRASAVVPR